MMMDTTTQQPANTYATFDINAFTSVLDTIANDFNITYEEITATNLPNRLVRTSKEHMYTFNLDAVGAFRILILSSVDKRDADARDCGEDAIRMMVLGPNGNSLVSAPYTKRIGTWAKNLDKKLRDLLTRYPEELRACSECGRPMAIRTNNSNGNKFWGCTGWSHYNPDCTNNESYTEN